jgi:hypothetical protein
MFLLIFLIFFLMFHKLFLIIIIIGLWLSSTLQAHVGLATSARFPPPLLFHVLPFRKRGTIPVRWRQRVPRCICTVLRGNGSSLRYGELGSRVWHGYVFRSTLPLLLLFLFLLHILFFIYQLNNVASDAIPEFTPL